MKAVEQAHSLRPNLILMDLGMPHLDGWEATRRIKADPRTQHLPVLAISGHAFPDAVRRAKESGADAFCAKPCRPPMVLQKVRDMLS